VSGGPVLVLGGGLEGLTAAACLARAGRAVTLVEEGEHAGGAFGAPRGAVPLELGGLRRELVASLELERHGLSFAPAPEPYFAPGPDGLVAGAEPEARTKAWLERIRPFLESVLDAPPPALLSPTLGQTLEALRTGWRLRRLGGDDMQELMRIVPQSAADWTEEAWSSEADRLAVTVPALTGSILGPIAPSSAGLVLLRLATRRGEPVGGAPAVAKALALALEGKGGTIRTGTAVERIDVSQGRVSGVTLAGGESLAATCVVSGLPLRRTWLELLHPREVPRSVERAVRHWRARTDVLLLELSLPATPGTADPRRFTTVRRMLDVERAMDDWKHGRIPEHPVLDVAVTANGDRRRVRVAVRGTPPLSPEVLRTEVGPSLRARVLEILEPYLPGCTAAAGDEELRVPDGGHAFDGELALDQLWVRRPSLELARHRTPIAGLFLAGPGAHPGGAFPCGAGALAARAVTGA